MSRCGSLRTKPTVSVSNSGAPPGRSMRRVVGSSVAKSLSSTNTSAPVSFLQQAGLARVGVAHDGRVRHGGALTLLALGGALAADFLQFGFDVVDALAHEPPVGFELALALALAAEAAALLAAEVPPGPREPGQGILHAREFDLEPRLPRPGATVENVQDDLLAVDHGQAAEFLPFALLAGGQLVVEDDHVALQRLGLRDDFLRLARADEIGRLRTVDAREHLVGDGQAEGVHEFAEFGEQAACFLEPSAASTTHPPAGRAWRFSVFRRRRT